jgi:hypothetical protein
MERERETEREREREEAFFCLAYMLDNLNKELLSSVRADPKPVELLVTVNSSQVHLNGSFLWPVPKIC